MKFPTLFRAAFLTSLTELTSHAIRFPLDGQPCDSPAATSLLFSKN